MKETKRKDEVKNFYLNKTRTQNTGQRIEKVRVVLDLYGVPVAKSRSHWCTALHISRPAYAQIIRNEKPIPMTVWPALYDFGVDLNWFLEGSGAPFRKDSGNIPDKAKDLFACLP